MKKMSGMHGSFLIAALAAWAGVLTPVHSARADGVEAWGWNYYAQVGNNSTANCNAPVAAQGVASGVTAVAAGWSHSLALQNGGVCAWGSNQDAQLGGGIGVWPYPTVSVVGLSSGVTAIAAGGLHSLAIQNGRAYAWGDNYYGAVGDGTTTTFRYTPVPVVGLSSGVTAIAGGYTHSLAIQNGGAYAWGDNWLGELGDGTTTQRNAPVPVSGLSSGVTAISGGVNFSLAIQNGGVYGWGDNGWGQLGDGTTTPRNVPVAVHGLSSGVSAIAAGGDHGLAVQNGGVWAWGDNQQAQLGDGTTNNSLTPERIDPADLTHIIAVAAGVESSYALSADGSLWVWGDNSYGELGLGTTVSGYKTPQHLRPPVGYRFTSISADSGGSDALATLAAVPEPASLGLLALGGLGLLGRRRS